MNKKIIIKAVFIISILREYSLHFLFFIILENNK